MAIDVKPVGEGLGAEVRGVDLAGEVPESAFGQIIDAWHRHLVLVFPDQRLTNERHIAFSRKIGPLEVHPSGKYVLKSHPEILLLTNKKDAAGNYISLRDGGTVWHSDLSYMKHPSKASLLYAIDVPKDGGDTEWANMYRAYEMLPQRLKEKVEGLKAVHQFDAADNPRLRPPESVVKEGAGNSMWEKKSSDIKSRTPNVVHPVVRTHPDTRRKALFVNRRFTLWIEGMPRDESEELLLELFDYSERRDNVYHHRWTQGQLLMWDNRCTIHLACGGVPDGQLRTMQRTTVLGEAPIQ
jgi:taurine dioxygenase